MKKNNLFVATVLFPALGLLSVFIVIPIIGSFVISLFDYNPLRGSNTFLGLDNYARMLADKAFLSALSNTLRFVGVAVLVNITLTLTLSQFISGIKRKWLRNLFLVGIFMPCIAPVANSAVVWSRSLFPTKGGLINQIISAFGGSPVNWVGDPLMVIPSIIFFTVWVDIGYNTILFTAGTDGIPTDFHEAAVIDGAGPLTRFFMVTLPLLGRTLTFVIAMTLISHFQMFAQFHVMTKSGGGPGGSSWVLTTLIHYSGFTAKDMGYASAISVALFSLILLATIIQQRLNRVDWEY